MDKLIKQLKRDFKKNPKKVVLLGLLGLVCLWVCIPLVFPPEEKKPVRKTAAATATASAPIAAAATSSTAAPLMRWQDLDRLLAADPRMQVSDLLAVGGASRTSVDASNKAVAEFDVDAAMDELLEEVAATMEYEKQMAPSKARLDAIPLELTSTIVGDGVRSAVINGRMFREGDKLGKAAGEVLVLKVVEPRLVVVEWNGLSRELKILRPGERAAGGIAAKLGGLQ